VPLSGEYLPSTSAWARKQAEAYEASGGAQANTLQGKPVIVLTSVGATSGKLRKTALMRVEHEGRYAVVASKGGTPENPAWYRNLVEHPHVELQDGPVRKDYTAHEAEGAERDEWWARAIEVWPAYAGYQKKTDRLIPVLVLEPLEE
jgi:deazaflavin-dependent oxidoreductase (nitroreductase family)